jgi:hypothetical protein
MSLDDRHDELLNAIEDVERQSLAWGDVDGSISPEEAVALAEPLFGSQAEDAVEALIEATLLYVFDAPGAGERYRSRFAEIVRLLSRSRQIFSGEPWRGAPPLVADFRVDLRPRRYARRDLERADLADRLDGLTALQRAVLDEVAPTHLAAFQIRAAEALLAAGDGDRGTIVTAGTGSGKTLAFYLPVFLRLADQMEATDAWVQAIAIYPRNELLKDQLTEAYRNAGRCAAVMRAAKGRPLRLGTYYGDTPRRADLASLTRWPARGTDFLCPFLRCDCGGEFYWRLSDVEARRERLTCAACGATSDEERLALTRESQARRPPDILFTTTEMVNRSLSDPRRFELFGVARPRRRRPEFLLLDEAHTYTGVSGAQAALTLRRWRALHGGPLSWIGLSATLAESPKFFADLTGLDTARVTEIAPAEDEMQEEGREYQVALRGDPASRASLLSTSIQSLMLIARALDPQHGRSNGRFGRRVFAFTDDLDVTHRLYDNLRDAEAYDRWGRVDGLRHPLAVMRANDVPGMPTESDEERRARDAGGQRWRLPEGVGRPLATRLIIGRTTGRDPGVDGRADVIVATSALEVGFNDPLVGAVLQHKAPRSFASFLQRRGRAGRNRSMRPITITVLSDYGRDRQLFQGFEHLFDPELAPQSLPVRNQYILRMQAAFALLDWIAQQPRAADARTGSVWQTASRPFDSQWDNRGWADHVRKQVSLVVRGDDGAIASFGAHLRNGLGVDEATVERLLWEPPRSLLLEVAPTLLSRLYRDWQLAWPQEGRFQESFIPDHPMPEFVPRALFADLNLPEVEFILPPATRLVGETRETLPIYQALSQLAPGRVTRRFGDIYSGLAHWSPLPAGVEICRLPISSYAERAEFVGRFAGLGPDGPVERNVYRPWRVRLSLADPNVVRPTSNATMIWASGFETHGLPVEIVPPARTAWRGLVSFVHFHLQQYRASVSVRRFAIGARSEVRRGANVTEVVEVRFTDDADTPSAIGFAFETDGLSVGLRLPARATLEQRKFERPLERGLRTAYLRRLVQMDIELPRQSNDFQRAWLRQIHLLTVASRALERRVDLATADADLFAAGDPAAYDAALDALIGIQAPVPSAMQTDVENSDDAVESEQDADRGGRLPRSRLDRLRQELCERLADGQVRARLSANLSEAQAFGSGWAMFLRATLETTLADLLIAAVTVAAPRHVATDTLVVDIDPDPFETDDVTLRLTETTVGGAGVLQAVVEPFAMEPRALFRSLEAALEPDDLELASATLAQAYRICGESPEIAALVGAVRGEVGHSQRAVARTTLLAALQARGLDTGRAAVVSLNARLLASAMRPEHDALVRALLDFWDRVESTLGIEFEPREIAVLAASDSAIQVLTTSAALVSEEASVGTRVAALASLMWPRASMLRRDGLTSYNPYRPGSGAEPALIRALLLDTDDAVVRLDQDDWETVILQRLQTSGVGRVAAPIEKRSLLRMALVRLPATPVTLGALTLYPTLERVSREEDRLLATFVLKEQV